MQFWSAAEGTQVQLPLTHGDLLRGAAISKDEARILTWSGNTARLWDAATRTQVGSALTHDDDIRGAVFLKDEARILTWSRDKTARLWNVGWAMRDVADSDFVRDICRQILVGASVRARTTRSAEQVPVGLRHLDAGDTVAVPILRGREGEDVCVPPPTTWETLLSLLWSLAQ